MSNNVRSGVASAISAPGRDVDGWFKATLQDRQAVDRVVTEVRSGGGLV
ncbi:hypothetical protein [Actinoplanes solisilvae]|nr:hypothetical protein [Actinoplanes solisilvae]